MSRRFQRCFKLAKTILALEEGELIDCNPEYAHIRFRDGKEQTVSLRQLAPVEEDRQTLEAENTFDPDTNSEAIIDQQTGANENQNAQNLLNRQQRVRPYVLRSREA